MAMATPEEHPSARWVRLGIASASAVAVPATVLLFNHVLARTTGAGLFPSVGLLAAIAAASIVVRRDVRAVGPMRSAATGALVGVVGVLVAALLLFLLFVAVCSTSSCVE